MVRRKVSPVSDSVPKRIPLKYCSQVIIPDELVKGDLWTQEYELVTGELVTFDYCATTNNTNGRYDASLDRDSMRLLGVPFSVLQQAWYSRLGKLSGWWHTVKLVKL